MDIRERLRAFDSVFRMWPFSPNILTLTSLLFVILGVIFFRVIGNFWYGFLLIGLSFLVDGLDGAVARAKGKVTKFGGFLDGTLDRIVEAIILISILPVPGFMPPEYLLPFNEIVYFYSVLGVMVFGSFLTSFVLAYARSKGILDESIPVVLPRTYRVVGIWLGLLKPNLFPLLFVMSVISFLQRFMYVWRVSKNEV